MIEVLRQLELLVIEVRRDQPERGIAEEPEHTGRGAEDEHPDGQNLGEERLRRLRSLVLPDIDVTLRQWGGNGIAEHGHDKGGQEEGGDVGVDEIAGPEMGSDDLIAEQGGFEGIEGAAACFEYWSLARASSGERAGKRGYVTSPIGGRNGLEAEEFTALAAEHFIAAAEKWLTGNEPFTAKLHPEYAPYGDYDQLMRLDEWYGRER